MASDIILAQMKAYVKSHKPEIDPQTIDSLPVVQVLTASIDVVDFVLSMEEKLQLEEDIDLDRLGPRIMQNITFAELSTEIGQLGAQDPQTVTHKSENG